MSIIADQTVPATVDDWCERVRELHTELACPITDHDDPRVAEYATATSSDHLGLDFDVKHNPEVAGERYFAECVELPPAPVSGPGWAAEYGFSVSWPHVYVEFVSEEIQAGEVTAYATQAAIVQVAADENAPAGTISDDRDVNVTLIVEGHPIDFYGASLRSMREAAAALLMVSVAVGEELDK